MDGSWRVVRLRPVWRGFAGRVRTNMPGELGDLVVGEDHYMFEV